MSNRRAPRDCLGILHFPARPRSTSNDIAQVCLRCNVDYQYLPCAPVWPANEEGDSALLGAAVPPGTGDGGAGQPAGAEGDAGTGDGGGGQPAAQDAHPEQPPRKRTRIRGKTNPPPSVGRPPVKKRDGRASWLPGVSVQTPAESACLRAIRTSFAKAAGMDFYITKYQGKPMEALTPLFKCMTEGVHRLEKQEAEEEEEARAKAAAEPDAAQPPISRRKTQEELIRRARRLTSRLAAMGNRSFWLSAAELTVHLLTDGDCLQSHTHQKIYTRSLQWSMQDTGEQRCHHPCSALPLPGAMVVADWGPGSGDLGLPHVYHRPWRMGGRAVVMVVMYLSCAGVQEAPQRRAARGTRGSGARARQRRHRPRGRRRRR